MAPTAELDDEGEDGLPPARVFLEVAFVEAVLVEGPLRHDEAAGQCEEQRCQSTKGRYVKRGH